MPPVVVAAAAVAAARIQGCHDEREDADGDGARDSGGHSWNRRWSARGPDPPQTAAGARVSLIRGAFAACCCDVASDALDDADSD